MARNQYKGFNLFFDISDEELRSYNQACVLTNIAIANRTEQKSISPLGAAIIMGYMREIAPQFRQLVINKFQIQMAKEGFITVQ